MKKKPNDPDAEFKRRYPTVIARYAADAVIDKMSNTETMEEYLRTWSEVYEAHGGVIKS